MPENMQKVTAERQKKLTSVTINYHIGGNNIPEINILMYLLIRVYQNKRWENNVLATMYHS